MHTLWPNMGWAVGHTWLVCYEIQYPWLNIYMTAYQWAWKKYRVDQEGHAAWDDQLCIGEHYGLLSSSERSQDPSKTPQ